MDKCQSSCPHFFSQSFRVLAWTKKYLKYSVSDDPPNFLFGENLWVVIMIVFGVTVIFVTIAKRKNNMDDNQEDHDFDRLKMTPK